MDFFLDSLDAFKSEPLQTASKREHAFFKSPVYRGGKLEEKIGGHFNGRLYSSVRLHSGTVEVYAKIDMVTIK